MSVKKNFIALICFASAGLVASPAFAGTKDDVRDLQARMQEVERSVAAGSAATVRISELEREIQVLTGRIEELTYQLEQSNARMTAITAALAGGETPLATPDALGGQATPGGPIDLTTGDPIADQISRETTDGAAAAGSSDVALPLDPDAAFDYASSFLLQGDYQRAKDCVSALHGSFPESSTHAGCAIPVG